MMPLIQFGPAALPATLLAFVAAVWLGTQVAEYEGRRRALPWDLLWNVVSVAAVAAVAGGRLAYVVRNWSVYAGAPLEVVALTPTTLAPDVAAILAGVAALAYVQHRRVPPAVALDAAAPGALVALGLLAIGQFLSGDAFGTPAVLPWSVFVWGDLRHPVQLYEALGLGCGLGIVWLVRRRRWHPGMLMLIATAWYGAVRVGVDAFRADVILLPGGYRASQVIGWVVLVATLVWMARIETGKREEPANARSDSND